MTRNYGVIFVMALVAGGCGEPDRGTRIVETQQPLRAFGNWAQMPGGRSYRAPVIIPSDNAGTMVAAVGTDNEVYTSSSQDPGGIGATWQNISSFGTPTNLVLSHIAGAGLLGETGTMANAVVLAYNSDVDHMIYIRVQNQTGSVVFHDWDPLPPLDPDGMLGISMTWLPKYSASGSQRLLLLVATKTHPDGQVYVSGNSLRPDGIYNHANWSSFTAMRMPGGDLPNTQLPFPDNGPVAVAAAWACPLLSTDYSFVVAAGVYRPEYAGEALGDIYFAKYSANAGGWSPWTLAQDHVFGLSRGGGTIGLAAGCGDLSHEMTLVGMDEGPTNVVYVDSRQVSGFAPSWTSIGGHTFPITAGTLPLQLSAGNSAGRAWVTAVDNNDLSMYYTSAETP